MSAQDILITGGVFQFAYAFFLGFFMTAEGFTQGKVSHYLSVGHVTSFMQGSMLIALTLVLDHVQLSDGMMWWSALLLVLGSALLAMRDTANWRQKIKSEFTDKPIIGQTLGTLSILCATTGYTILLVGFIRGM